MSILPQTVYTMKIQFYFPCGNDNLYKDFKKYNLRRLFVQRQILVTKHDKISYLVIFKCCFTVV